MADNKGTLHLALKYLYEHHNSLVLRTCHSCVWFSPKNLEHIPMWESSRTFLSSFLVWVLRKPFLLTGGLSPNVTRLYLCPKSTFAGTTAAQPTKGSCFSINSELLVIKPRPHCPIISTKNKTSKDTGKNIKSYTKCNLPAFFLKMCLKFLYSRHFSAFLCTAVSALIPHLSWGGGQKCLRRSKTAPDRHKCSHLSWMAREWESEWGRERESEGEQPRSGRDYAHLHFISQHLPSIFICCERPL